MKIYASMIIGLVLVLFGISCSKKESVTPPCLVTKITANQYSSAQDLLASWVYTYEYNADHHLTKSVLSSNDPTNGSTTTTYNYTYTNGNVSSMTSSGTNEVSQSTWTHENGHLTKVTGTVSQSGAAESPFTRFFFYDSEGRLDSMHAVYGAGASGSTVDFSMTYNSDGNLASLDLDFVGQSSSFSYHIVPSGYDANNNVYSLLAKALGESDFVYGYDSDVNYYYLNKNNPSTDAYTGSTTDGDSYTYEFNNHKYPTKSTSLETNGGGSVITTYEYSNCN